MRSIFLAILCIVPVLIVAGCSEPAPRPSAAEPPTVRVARVGGGMAADEIVATGTIALRRETSLGFTSAGRIARLNVDDGDDVRAGQVLASLDATVLAADMASAQAERQRATAELARSRTLLKQGWVTQARVDAAQATYAAADARVRTSGFQSRTAVIAAPGPGRILARLAEPGQVVAAGTPVLVLGEAASGYILRVPLTDRDAARIGRGAPAQVVFGDGSRTTGSVSEIGGRADPLTGTFAVEIALPSAATLRSGQIASARIASAGAGSTMLAVPPAAVFAPRAGEGFVYVVDAANRLSLRKVALSDAGDDAIRVRSGLRAGEDVAVSRVDRLAAGMTIRRATYAAPSGK